MKKSAVGLGIVLLIAAFAIPAFGRGPVWNHGWTQGPCVGHDYDRGQRRGMDVYRYGPHTYGLNLTDEQKSKVESVRESHLKEMTPLRSELYTKKTELRALWAQKTPDRKAILAKQKEISKLRDQMSEKRTVHRLDMRGILTSEQQEQLSARKYGRVHGRHGGFGSGYGKYHGFGAPQGQR